MQLIVPHLSLDIISIENAEAVEAQENKTENFYDLVFDPDSCVPVLFALASIDICVFGRFLSISGSPATRKGSPLHYNTILREASTLP